MEAIVVTEMKSSLGYSRSLHNRVAWRQADVQRIILAVGAREEWSSPAALPPSAVVTDLVAAAVDDPALARLLWGAFLTHLAHPHAPRWYFMLPRLLRPAVPVTVKLAPRAVSSAVATAINRSQGSLRFKVRAAA